MLKKIGALSLLILLVTVITVLSIASNNTYISGETIVSDYTSIPVDTIISDYTNTPGDTGASSYPNTPGDTGASSYMNTPNDTSASSYTNNDTYTSYTFPTLHITSHYDPFTVERNFWHNGTLSLEGNNTQFACFQDADIRIRGRGRSSWRVGMDKRPLRIRFEDARPLMNSHHSFRDWILVADYFDRSLLRNYAALYFGNLMMGQYSFVPRAYHVQLYVNDQYMGVYLLTDERDVAQGRMELESNSNPVKSDFFLQLDGYPSEDIDENEIIVNGLLYEVRFPRTSRLTQGHIEYTRDYLATLSYAIRKQCFETIASMIDLDSFVDFYIIQELFRNPDAHISSVFMYIQGVDEDRRLFMGPIWDFDLAAGNNITPHPMRRGYENLHTMVYNYWFRNLMQIPEFFDAVVYRWNEVSNYEIPKMITHVAQVSLNYQHEFERNFERHQILGKYTWRTPDEIIALDSFIKQVDFLVGWLNGRTNFLDDFFNGNIADFDPLWTLIDYHTYDRPIGIALNGELLQLDIPPIRLHHRTMLSLCELANIFNMEAGHSAGIAYLNSGTTVITHDIGSSFLTINDTRINFSAPTIMINEYVFMPLRFVAEPLGYRLEWLSDIRAINIVTNM